MAGNVVFVWLVILKSSASSCICICVFELVEDVGGGKEYTL